MSDRFNRNDVNVPDDRLFPADFIVDQNGQDADFLQLARDFGCLPCIGSGLEVTSYSDVDHKIEISAGWAYDVDGRRITVESARQAVLAAWDNTTNYVIISHDFETDTSRPAHRTGTSYDTRKADSFTITVTTTSPGVDDIVLATCTQDGTDPIVVSEGARLERSCKLIAQSMIPEVLETPPSAQPPGQQPELPDLPRGRKVPMPIILGIETVMPEELGRTTAAVSTLTLERVNLKSGTPIADVKIWIGDWGSGQRDGSDTKKCNFDMNSMHSGITSWDDDLWITDPPGYYYLVRHDESWFSRVTDSGSDWVICEDDVPSGSAAEYYICPYAERYRVETVPYQTDAVLAVPYAINNVDYCVKRSPTSPVITARGLNLGGKYRLKVASMITGDNFTKWAEADFIVGSDLLLCWQPAAASLTLNSIDGGVEVVIPGIIADTALPEAYELCYTYGLEDVAEPDFDNSDHPTVRIKDRRIKLDVPPGYKVKVRVRAINRRMIMRCTGTDVILTPDYTNDKMYFAGGVSRLRNRKTYANPISEADLAQSTPKLVDQQKLANPIWVETISLFNPTDTAKTNFEVYVHGSTQNYSSGRKIQIGGQGCDETEVGVRGWVQKEITDYRITDPAMKVTIVNTTTSQSFDLRYTIQYKEDSENVSG